MKKTAIISITLFLLFLIVLLYISLIKLNSENSNLAYRTHIKALCNTTNYCQDYSVSCDGKRAIMTSPITGAIIQQSEDWTDPRNESARNSLC